MELITIYEDFVSKFEPLLGHPDPKAFQFQRWPAFHFIAKHLIFKNKPVLILETGCIRDSNNWLGNGQSTMVWDWLVNRIGGSVYSVDINHDNIKLARELCSSQVNFIHCDSMGALRQSGGDVGNLDLLYLDSYDWSPELHISSCLHHMGELAAVWDRIPSGCLIAVDDAHNETQGKHVMVKLFFDHIVKIPPLVVCHTLVWMKP